MVATIRDIAIIVVAFFDFVLLILLVAIAFVIWRLLLTLRSEMLPLLGSVKKTATTVEGTTDFVSTTVAMPLIRAVSLVFAVTRFFQVLLGYASSSEERHQ